MSFILLLGMLPPFLLIRYMYKLDQIEKEPARLLIKLFIFGGLTTWIASILESVGVFILGTFVQDPYSVLYLAIMNFIVVGISEEGVKYFVLKKVSWYHPDFNYLFDAVVYSVCVSLGFAAFENVMYILNFGIGVAPIRAVTAIPMHCITGIFMGHYYGQAKLCETRHNWDGMRFNNILAVLVPVILHGFYDFAASSEDNLLDIIFLIYVVVVDVVAFISVKKFAREDYSL